MIKRLRRKFIWINMVLMVTMLLVIFGLVYHFTSTSLEESGVSALKAVAGTQLIPGRPGSLNPEATTHYFILDISAWGDIMAVGSEAFDLTDGDMLWDIYRQAKSDGGQVGILEEYSLRFYRTDSLTGTRFVFGDITVERQTLSNLIKTCAVIFVIAFFGLLGISILLARWAVRPVELAWQQQRQFVADASHELKTPLTVILTNAELLQSPDYPAGEKGRFADSILTMSRQMRGLVESLLELARVDNGQVAQEYRQLDYSRLVEDAVLPFEPVYFESGLTLESSVEPGVTVHGSQRYLRQVAEILLDNGRKYAAPASTVYLNLSRQGKGRCLLRVTSAGETLTPQQCKDIFKRFYRTDNVRTVSGSYGLGLSIAQRIVSEHRGKIWAQGKDGYNTFFVSLPEG